MSTLLCLCDARKMIQWNMRRIYELNRVTEGINHVAVYAPGNMINFNIFTFTGKGCIKSKLYQ